MPRYLVTGGAGFVGSHVVAAMLDRGDEVVVLDTLQQGHRQAVLPGARLVEADVLDRGALDAVLAQGRWDAVLHFAALSLVGESMTQPCRYLLTNVVGGVQLIEACVQHGISRFVLSSTANLFSPSQDALDEDARIDPMSPYGESKRMIERSLAWADRIHGLRSACLRYFNAAGADPQGRLGEDHDPETHLIPLAIDAALGRRPAISLFGSDYPTPDGTCIRDYVHVSDLAVAHLAALEQLGMRSVTYNIGTGHGHSVKEIIAVVGKVVGRPVPVIPAPRRPGDPPMLVAASTLLRAETGWAPRFTDLAEIVRTAYDWRLAHPGGYEGLA